MFYSGTTKLVERFSVIGMFFLLMCKISTNQFSLKFDYAGLSDSVPLLNIVSSPVFTLLVFQICVLYVYISKRTQRSNIIVLWLIILNYYFVMNSYTAKVNGVFATMASNLTLQNGLLNIHPYIIYQLYGFVCIYLLVRMLKVKTYHQYYFNANLLRTVNLLILIGILLGAWWAAQEFNWGGFWSWDPVELISLLLLLFIVNLQHRNLDNFSTLRLSYYILLSTVVYCIMRLGLVSTIHSFIKNTSVPYYSYCIFVFVMFVSSILFLQSVVSHKVSSAQNQYSTTTYFVLLISTLSVFLINLILINFNILSYYFLFSLSILYFLILAVYTIGLFLTKFKFVKFYTVAMIAVYIILYCFADMFIIFCLFFITLFVRKKSWLLHITAFTLYITAVFFFYPLTQNYKLFLSYLTWYNVTDYYANFNMNGLLLSNFFLKKNVFVLTLKNYVHHGLGFITYTKYFISQFLSFRNNNLAVTYGEESVFTIVLIYVSICMYNYKTFSRWNIINY